MSINIRDIKQEDIPAIRDIVRLAWYEQNAVGNMEVTQAYVQMDINFSLNESSYGKVAELNGKVVGVVLGRIEDQPKNLRMLQTDGARELATLLKAPKHVQNTILAETKEEIDTDLKMLEESDQNYDGSVTLFAVLEEAQGKGIGSQLFNEIIKYFKTHQVKQYYLFTDSGCNYQFYDYKGLNRRRSISYNDKPHTFTYYLYDYTFANEHTQNP